MRRSIQVSDKNLQKKLSQLLWNDEVVVCPSNNRSLSRVLSSINSDRKRIDKEVLGNRVLLRRLSPLNVRFQYRK